MSTPWVQPCWMCDGDRGLAVFYMVPDDCPFDWRTELHCSTCGTRAYAVSWPDGMPDCANDPVAPLVCV